MNENQDDIQLLEELLDVRLPKSYVDMIGDGGKGSGSGALFLGLPISLELDSAWGATEFVRAAREDLDMPFVALRLAGTRALCLDLGQGDERDAPVVLVDLDGAESPKKVSDSLVKYLKETQPDDLSIPADSLGPVEQDEAFQNGLAHLERHLEQLSFNYDHKKGGRLPRSHLWRPYRFCVQDVILGIVVLRHDRKYNRLEVDVFLTAGIPEYAPESGCRALALIMLSDAYKSGGSMEIKFSEHVESGHVPDELCRLAGSLGVQLRHAKEGGITPKEAKSLYLALSGFGKPIADRVMSMEKGGRLSAAAVCYAMHHGVWTAEELEIIFFGSGFPDRILKGSVPPEAWRLFDYDIFHARNALMGGYLDRHVMNREHLLEKEGEVVELEDDERNVEISFSPNNYVKTLKLLESDDRIFIPWLHNQTKNPVLRTGQRLRVLLRARDVEDLKQRFRMDLEQIRELKQKAGNGKDVFCIMVPGDFKRMETGPYADLAEKCDIGIIVCPEFLTQLDQEVCRRFESIKVMRQ